ncbi:MAG: hypothetical protein WAZ40_02570 [Minisyncoccia bacterium]
MWENELKPEQLPLSKVEKIKKQSESVSGVYLDNFTKEELLEKYRFKKIVVAGPPRSGKSCFNTGIKVIIKSIPNAPYPFIFTACPDGEGSWFQETTNNHPELASQIKQGYKGKFTPEFVAEKSKSVANLGSESSPLSFIDIGGIISSENAQICKNANAGIILCGEEGVENNMIAEWKQFFTELKIPVIAEIYSDYSGKEDIPGEVDSHGTYRGSVHHLERGENLSDRETLRDLADHILSFEKRSK